MDIQFIIKRMLERKEKHSKAKCLYKELARSGWFLCGYLGLSDYERLVESLDSNEDRDALFMDVYESEINYLSSLISNDFPNRKKLIDECVLAHSNGMFYLSTIGFLSLADGICHDGIDWSIFEGSGYIDKVNEILCEVKRRNDSLPEYIRKFSVLSDMYLNTLSIMDEKLYIAYTEKMRKREGEYKSTINRHVIMHGEDCSFGTRINSLKAFSFLCFSYDLIKIKKIHDSD